MLRDTKKRDKVEINKYNIDENPCPHCSKPVYWVGDKKIGAVILWCSSYGEKLPWEGDYPDACGYRLMPG